MAEQNKIADRQKLALTGAALCLLTFALSRVSFDVGMGVGIGVGLMDITLHPCARFFKFPWQIVCFALPVAVSQLLWGNVLIRPCIIVVRLVCVLMVSKIYHGLPEQDRDSSVLPLLVHGFWFLIGVGLYDAMVFGLVKFLSGLLVAIVEWVVSGSLSVLLMRLLSRTLFKTGTKEELR